MADAKMPRPVAILGNHLRSAAEVTAIVAQRTSVKLATTLPAIRLALVSNAKRGPEEWDALVQVECWAAKDETCDDIAVAVEHSLPALAGQRTSGYVVAADVRNVISSPDPETDGPRLIVTVELLIYATDT